MDRPDGAMTVVNPDTVVLPVLGDITKGPDDDEYDEYDDEDDEDDDHASININDDDNNVCPYRNSATVNNSSICWSSWSCCCRCCWCDGGGDGIAVLVLLLLLLLSWLSLISAPSYRRKYSSNCRRGFKMDNGGGGRLPIPKSVETTE